MRRALVMALVLGALGAGCKRKPALVKTPIRQLAPIEGASPAAPQELATAEGPPSTEFAAQPQSPTDAQAPAAVPIPKKPAPPSVANPYTWGKERLPLYKQRAKFF
jgi:hypothetical protein